MMDFDEDMDIFFNEDDFGTQIENLTTGKKFTGLFDYQTEEKSTSSSRYPSVITHASNVKDIESGSLLLINCKTFKVRNQPEFTLDSEVVELKLSDKSLETVTGYLPS